LNIAIVTCDGLGDGLIMMSAAHILQSAGHKVTLFNNHLPALQDWFIATILKEKRDLNLEGFDAIILQHDNSELTKELIARYRNKMHIFYPTYDKARHPPITPNDAVAMRKIPLAKAIAQMTAESFDCPNISGNGITPKEGLIKHKHLNRVILHPSSSTPLRTWPLEKFIEVALWLKARGFAPMFCLSPKEREALLPFIPKEIQTPLVENLNETASLIYESHFVIGNESGLVHLASNLDIPFLVISGHKKRIEQWQPGWRDGRIVTPKKWVLNIKGLRLREKQWQSFITTHHVIKALLKCPEIALS
jgi:ADP-heptose:LPS heptosyltransferase